MKLFHSLKAKIVMAVVLILILCFAIFSIVNVSIVKRNVEDAIMDRSIAEANQIAGQAELLVDGGASDEDLQKFVEKQVSDNSYLAYAIVIDSSVTAVAHSDTEKIGKQYDDDYSVSAARDGQVMSSKFYADVQKAWTYDIMVPITLADGSHYGAMDVGIYETYVSGIVAKIRGFVLIMTIASCILAGVIVMLICSILFKNFTYLVNQCQIMGEGDFSNEFSKKAISQKDEIGEMSRALNHMRIELSKLILSTKLETENIIGIAGELQESSVSTTKGSEEIVTAIQSVVDGSEKQCSLAEETAIMTQDITKGMESVAENIQIISESSANTLSSAQHGNEIIEAVMKQMDLINQKVTSTAEQIQLLDGKSNEIGKAVEYITNIASQTNLLALNASIEAARAGEQGKGFAVVADQVSVLADQSAKAASEIVALITEVQNSVADSIHSMEDGTASVETGIQLAKEAGDNFVEILNDINRMTQEISGVSSASEEVNASTNCLLESINGIADIASSTAENTQTVFASVQNQKDSMNSISDSSTSLSKMSDDLNEQVKIFKLEEIDAE